MAGRAVPALGSHLGFDCGPELGSGGGGAVEVALTMLAFRLPDFCFKFYGDHITYGTHWQLITMLPESDLKQSMIRVMEEELWQKGLWNQGFLYGLENNWKGYLHFIRAQSL